MKERTDNLNLKAQKLEQERIKQEEKIQKVSCVYSTKKQMSVDPRLMFLTMMNKYSLFDGEGLPTHDSKG